MRLFLEEFCSEEASARLIPASLISLSRSLSELSPSFFPLKKKKSSHSSISLWSWLTGRVRGRKVCNPRGGAWSTATCRSRCPSLDSTSWGGWQLGQGRNSELGISQTNALYVDECVEMMKSTFLSPQPFSRYTRTCLPIFSPFPTLYSQNDPSGQMGSRLTVSPTPTLPVGRCD